MDRPSFVFVLTSWRSGAARRIAVAHRLWRSCVGRKRVTMHILLRCVSDTQCTYDEN